CQLRLEQIGDALTLTDPFKILGEGEQALSSFGTAWRSQPQRVLTELGRVTCRASRAGRCCLCGEYPGEPLVWVRVRGCLSARRRPLCAGEHATARRGNGDSAGRA